MRLWGVGGVLLRHFQQPSGQVDGLLCRVLSKAFIPSVYAFFCFIRLAVNAASNASCTIMLNV